MQAKTRTSNRAKGRPLRCDQERAERKRQGKDRVRKPDQTQETRYPVFTSVFDCSPQERAQSCPRGRENWRSVGE